MTLARKPLLPASHQGPDHLAPEDMLAGISGMDAAETEDSATQSTEAVKPWARARARRNAGAATVAAAPAIDPVVAVERALVGAVLADNALYDTVIDVIAGAGDFLDDTARCIFKATADIIEGRVEGVKIAEPMALALLPGIASHASLELLQELTGSAEADPAVVVGRARAVRAAAAERGLGSAVSKAQDILAEADESVELKSEKILELLSGAAEVKSLPVTTLGQAALSAIMEMAERAQSGDSGVGIPTGFIDLDALTAGLHGGQLIVLAARPAVGKTAFAMKVGLSAAEAGFHVAMASLEMKASELSKRALAMRSGVDSHSIRVVALSESEWDRVISAGDELSKMPFTVMDLPTANLAALSGLARRLHREGKLDMLLIDYLQIMDVAGGRNVNREQQISELSRGLKKLAMQLDIPVVVLSQLNRSVESRADKRPMLSDLRESGAIEQDADVVIFIHRDGAEAEIIVAKQRGGALGTVNAIFEASVTEFIDPHKPRLSRTRAVTSDAAMLAANDPLRSVA